MPYIPGLRWKIYFFFYLPFTIAGILSILSSESPLYKYYHILIIFDAEYLIPYMMNLLSSLINVLSLVPLFLYAFHKKFLEPGFWRAFFVIKVFLDIVGHDYEFKFIKSTFYADITLGASTTFILLLITAPSYIAFFNYSFRWKKLFPKS